MCCHVITLQLTQFDNNVSLAFFLNGIILIDLYNMIKYKKHQFHGQSSGIGSFAWNGCSLWNDLPQDFRDVSSVHVFKATLRKDLMSRVPA